MPDYRRGSHSIYDIRYHFVWVTKYRYHVLTGEVARRARTLIRQTCLALEVEIQRGHVSKDHVHILVSCPPTLSPAVVMKQVKGRPPKPLAKRVSAFAKAVLGTPLLGSWLLLRDGRPGDGRADSRVHRSA